MTNYGVIDWTYDEHGNIITLWVQDIENFLNPPTTPTLQDQDLMDQSYYDAMARNEEEQIRG